MSSATLKSGRAAFGASATPKSGRAAFGASADLRDEVADWRPRWLTAQDPNTYTLTRFVFLRFLGLMYTVAFLVAANQMVPLVGAGGLEPAARFLENVEAQLGAGDAFVRLPTLFWLGASDAALYFVA